MTNNKNFKLKFKKKIWNPIYLNKKVYNIYEKE